MDDLLTAEDFGVALERLQEAPLAEFIRFVAVRLLEEPRLGAMSFRDGWLIMLGAFLEAKAAPSDG